MAKVISQETFDEVVAENITEFSMDPKEAKDETIKQFEAQGINLANIIKDLSINEETGKPILNECIDAIKGHVNSDDDSLKSSELSENLECLKSECNQSLPHRVLAAKLGGYDAIVSLIQSELASEVCNDDILLEALNAVNSIINKQPDIFNDVSLSIIMEILNFKEENKRKIICGALKWMAKACILHEINRQNIMNANILENLKKLTSTGDSNVTKDLCAVIRYLILDDDIRVQFGKAHEHARLIAGEIITDLTKLLKQYEDPTILADLLLTIASLIVRHEFSIAVEEAGGLQSLIDIVTKNQDSDRICRESLKLMRALAGHDTVKVHIVQQGAARIIHDILLTHMKSELLTKDALACISTLTLRVKENSTAFFEAGIPSVLVDAMKLHPQSKAVQRNGSWAIRNMVSRSRDQCDSFLSCGIEDMLNAAMTTHPSILQDLKSALRDLGCKVELKEEWTGKSQIKIIN